MRRFAKLYSTLDQTTKTNAKITTLMQYFSTAPAADAAWAIYFLCGQKIRRLVPTKLLRQWSAESAGIESWMFDECYEIVGDLAEVMALILPGANEASDLPLHRWVNERLEPLRDMFAAEQRRSIQIYWNQLSKTETLVLHKLMTGSFRVGVSKKLVVKALAAHSGIDAEVIAHRMMGTWEPSAKAFTQLLNPDTNDAAISRPYPFYLAHPLEESPAKLGDVDHWQAEWKWDGIRAQLICRQGEIFIWSRGEDLITDRFPELIAAANSLPDGVAIDGEIVGWKDQRVLPFSEMQRRIGRKKLGKKILSEVPVTMIAFDLLELNGVDVRQQPLHWRRKQLESVVAERDSISELQDGPPIPSLGKSSVRPLDQQPQSFESISDSVIGADNLSTSTIQLSKILKPDSWQELSRLQQRSREFQTEGLMLKRRSGSYQVGRPRGDWWKWKIEPYTIDAVLIYAQRGHGRRASLYTDYTFAVWDNGSLVPFAKAYSGLTDAEIRKVDHFVRQNTIDQFGPVRSVTPDLVFELAFENIQSSRRHKSGIAVRFPRISRWRDDLKAGDADSLDTIKAMMNADANSNSRKLFD